jgi:hypothetical protein
MEEWMKGILAATTMSLMLGVSTGALAQVQTPPSPNAQVQTPPSPNAQMQWYSHQASELRASKLIGTSVKNSTNEPIGSINEVILGKDGKVAAVVIGVGGFLGMGEHEVAVNFNSLRLSDDGNGKTLVSMDATKDSLKAAPQWTWATGERSTATGVNSAPTKPTNPSTK